MDFVRFLDVDVHDVVVVELPSQCEIIRASGGRSEDELTYGILMILHHLESLA